MTGGAIDRARSACHEWLVAQDAPEAVIARDEAAGGGADGEAARWVERILAEQDGGGAWSGELLWTAHALLTIQELRAAAGLAEQDPAIGRGLDWIRSRRGIPGSWADGCTPHRHESGLCHHFLGGFFSPAPPEVPYAEERLQCGARLSGDAEVRLVGSVTALRALLRWGTVGVDGRLHLEGLRRLVRLWEEGPPPGLGTTALLATVHALIASDADADREAAARGLRLVANKQRGDGSWVETDAFHALSVIGAAVDAGIAPERTRRALWHGARLLVASQQADGSLGAEYGPRRALIALRTFRRVDPG